MCTSSTVLTEVMFTYIALLVFQEVRCFLGREEMQNLGMLLVLS